jgi:Domain of unknown function (DUF4136)
MNGHQPRTFWIAALFVAGFCASCATTSVSTDHDPMARFGQFKTFAVIKGKVVNDGVVDRGNTLVTDRVQASVTENLQGKGLQAMDKAEGQPDLFVTYTVGSRTIRELDGVWAGYGWYVPSYDDNDVWIDEHTEGTLVIDLYDANTKKLVWRSVAKNENKEFIKAQDIDKAVSEALKKFPAT